MLQEVNELYNLDSERYLLSTLLRSERGFEKVPGFLRAHHFYEGRNRLIFEVLSLLYASGKQFNPETFRNSKEGNKYAEMGGDTYIKYLAQLPGSAISIPQYAETIFDLYEKRRMRDIFESAIQAISHTTGGESSRDIAELVEQELFSLATESEIGEGFRRIYEAFSSVVATAELAFKNKGMPIGVSTGIRGLDRIIGGLQKSDLVILAGRPAMGKTALAVNIAVNVAINKHHVAFASLEMSSDQLALRILSSISTISSTKIKRGEVTADEFAEIAILADNLKELSLYSNQTPAQTIAALRSACRKMKRLKGLDLIVVDYLQLVSSGKKVSENRTQEVSEITRGLKCLAKELNVPILALSQLSRNVENRADKRPMLSDLRESGSIEQDADIVMFIHREAPTDKTAPVSCVRTAELIIAKHRQGATGEVPLSFNGATTTFTDADEINHTIFNTGTKTTSSNHIDYEQRLRKKARENGDF